MELFGRNCAIWRRCGNAHIVQARPGPTRSSSNSWLQNAPPKRRPKRNGTAHPCSQNCPTAACVVAIGDLLRCYRDSPFVYLNTLPPPVPPRKRERCGGGSWIFKGEKWQWQQTFQQILSSRSLLCFRRGVCLILLRPPPHSIFTAETKY